MISFNRLGSMGRIGNQMFQYASLRGIAANNGYSIAIPPSPAMDQYRDHQMRRIFRLNSDIRQDRTTFISVSERGFGFDDGLFNNCPDNVDLVGYLQTQKYFMHIREELLKDFTFRRNYDKPFEEYVSVHVRRTDYVGQPEYHPVCEADYYYNAYDVVGDSLPIVVFSDDIEWCRNNIKADLYMEETTAEQDLFLMSKARHNIIANSSFSWWGAWLNQNDEKIVICPKQWFGPAYAHYNMNDLRPEEWIQI